MRTACLSLALVLPALCAVAECIAAEPASGPAAWTVGKLLADVGPAPGEFNNDAAIKAYQDKLNAKYAGQTVTVDAGTVIQIITEGGGVKLVSFPPEEPATDVNFARGLSHATLQPSEEAAGKKLVPGDSVKLNGTVVSISVKFEQTQDDKLTAAVHLTLKDAKIVGTTIAPKKKKAATAAD